MAAAVHEAHLTSCRISGGPLQLFGERDENNLAGEVHSFASQEPGLLRNSRKRWTHTLARSLF